MAEVIETARSHFPPWTWEYLPANTEELEVTLSQWLRTHASELQQLGQNIGTVLAHTLIGMIIGGSSPSALAPGFGTTTSTRPSRTEPMLGSAFRHIVFAQVEFRH